MCEYVAEAMYDAILQERKLERKRLYLERCLLQQEALRVELEIKGTTEQELVLATTGQ